MADNLTSTATQPLNSTPLGSITGVLQGGLNNLVNTGSGLLDKFFPPERRNEVKAKLSKFATEKPMLASFLLSQIALSGLPVFLFIALTIGVGVFALLAGLIIGIVGALLFIVVCAGIGLLILLPTLFVTTFAAAFIWLWGVGAYYIIKWFNDKPVPGIHKGAEGVLDQTGLGGIQKGLTDALNGDRKLPSADEQDPSSRPGQENKQEGKDETKDEDKPKHPKKLPNQPERKENTAPKQRTESPTAAKSPVRNNKSTGADLGNAGEELKKKTSNLNNVTNNIPGAQGIAI